MASSSPYEDDVYEDAMVWELVDTLKDRFGDDDIAWEMDLYEHDGYVPLACVLSHADGRDIPIPAHFEADVAHLVAEHEMEQRDLDLLREILADQRERGLISY